MKDSGLQFFAPTPRQRELQILTEIDRDPQVSQKELAIRVGLAPSMVNNYMKQLCDEDKVRKCGPNHKRITYHLTEAGQRMRDDLLSQYLTEGLRLYHALSEDLKRRLRRIQQDGISRVMLLGAAGACEAIERAAGEIGLEIVAVAEAMGGTQAAAAAPCGHGGTGGAERAQAVLLAEPEEGAEGASVVSGFRERGLPIYRV